MDGLKSIRRTWPEFLPEPAPRSPVTTGYLRIEFGKLAGAAWELPRDNPSWAESGPPQQEIIDLLAQCMAISYRSTIGFDRSDAVTTYTYPRGMNRTSDNWRVSKPRCA